MKISTRIMIGFAVAYVLLFTLQNLPKGGNEFQRIEIQFIQEYGATQGGGNMRVITHLRSNPGQEEEMVCDMTVFYKKKDQSGQFEQRYKLIRADQIFDIRMPPEIGGRDSITKFKFVLFRGQTELDYKYVSYTGPRNARNLRLGFIDRKTFDSL